MICVVIFLLVVFSMFFKDILLKEFLFFVWFFVVCFLYCLVFKRLKKSFIMGKYWFFRWGKLYYIN